MGLSHENYFTDGSLLLAFRHDSSLFQRCSQAIKYIMASLGFKRLYNYIDNLIYIGPPSNVYQAYSSLLSILADLGLDINQQKLVQPSASIICLGIEINTIAKIISIPQDKL